MSSLRNAVQRRNHRERAQPEARAKWGLLEKHKDYSLRAKDYNIKKAKLKRLREKAQDRNPDEFAFGMMSGTSNRQGRHGARDPTATLSHEAVKLLRTQDANYLRTEGQKIRRHLAKLEAEARLQQGVSQVLKKKEPASQRMVFVDSTEDVEMEGEEDEDEGESEDDFDFSAPPAQTGTQKLSKKELEKLEEARKQTIATRRLKKRAQESRLQRIEILRKQLEDITAAENELELQRAKMAHSVGGTNKDGIKWKVRERKR
ncbi:plasma membrane localization protein [Ascosphaera pollenicola]|nr:plasma membrane localization protein [Ascosphaera pollenicola]